MLKPNVEFWKNIYAKYSESEVIIHDSEDLGIVYEVVDLKTLFKGIYVSSRLQWKKIERIKKGYVSILLRLSKRKNLKLENLRGKEKFVATLFRHELTRKRLRRAARNIRAQNGLKERFKLGLERSGLYLSRMKEIFQEAGLPVELLVLPHVESSFNYKAYSKFGAAGIWQFTRSTGRRYMTINYTIDERLDPLVATESAAKLLKHNYQNLGSWPLAITAYNHGLNGMKKAKRKFGYDLGRIVKYYRSRSFGFASRNFYAEFLAALHITKNYKKYFGNIDFHRSKDFITFVTPDYITVNTLLKYLKITSQEFSELNPALRAPVLKSKRRIPKYFQIRIPMRDNLDVNKIYAQISPNLKFDEQIKPEWHKVRRGEHLSNIARKYRVPVSELMALNNIRNPHLIYVGQNLQIPTSKSPKYVRSKPRAKSEKASQLAEATDLKKKGDKSILDVPQTIEVVREPALSQAETTLLESPGNQEPARLTEAGDIAAPETSDQNRSSRGVSRLAEKPDFSQEMAAIEQDMALALPNYYVELTREMDARIVQVTDNSAESVPFRELQFPENGQVFIEPEETLGHFADWLNVPTQKLRAINGLSYRQAIHIGQPLWLTFEKVTPEEFHRRRVEYHQGIEEDFYRNYSIEGEKTYRIKRGENIWVICNSVFEIPYWLVKKHNPQKDLLRLYANEEIVIPIVEAKYQPSGLMDE
ncbi:MAG: LysM peptidoglycan-binding domain-containing protein [bacterium]